MATSSLDRSGLMVCPYNGHHRVKSSRFFQHLSACARQNPHIKLKQCPFNACHRVPTEEYEHHLLDCPDNLRAIRSFFDVSAKAKVEDEDLPEEFKAAKDKLANKPIREEDEEDDPWADEYIDQDKMSTMNYDVLALEEVTAEWLIDRRFNGRDHKVFTDTIFIQKMSHEERRKYQKLCVLKMKEIKELNDELADQKTDIDLEIPRSPVTLQTDNHRSEKSAPKKIKTENVSEIIRQPKSLPFTKVVTIGIGRGRGRGQTPATRNN